MADIVITVTGRGLNRVNKQFGGMDRQLTKVGRSGTRATSKLNKGFSRLNSSAGRLVGVLGGLGLALGGKALLDFDSALGQVQADSALTTAQMETMRKQILTLAADTGTSKTKLVAFIQEMQNLGGRTREAQVALPQISKLLKATGAEGAEVAQVMETLISKLGLTGPEAVKNIGKMVAAANAGTVRFADFAGIVAEVGATVATQFGNRPKQAIKNMNILAQVVGARFGGKADRAKEAIDALFRDLKRGKNLKLFKRAGIKIFDVDGNLKDIDEIARQVLVKFGDKADLQKKLGLTDPAIKVIEAFGGKGFDPKTGKFTKGSTTEAVRAASKRGGTKDIEEQFNRRVTGIDAAGQSLQRAMNTVDKTFQTFGKGVLKFATDKPALTAAGGVLGFGLLKVLGAGGGALGGIVGRGAGVAAAGAAGVPKVFVVNMPLGGGGLLGGGGVNAGGPAGALGGMIGKLGKIAGILGAVAVTSKITAEAIGTNLIGIQKEVAKRKVLAATPGIAATNVIRQAAQLGALAKGGAKTFEVRPGEKAVVTQSNMLRALEESAGKQGLSTEAIQALLPVLQGILSNVRTMPKKGEVPFKVSDGGIDAPKTKGARGKVAG